MRDIQHSIFYPSARPLLMANNIVSTSQPLAAQAGLEVLQQGGSAVDAALAAAITSTVVEPTGSGLGGDAFAIVWDGKTTHALNGSGPSPRLLTAELFKGQQAIPGRGWLSVTVPGMVKLWVELHRKFGKKPFSQLFERAIHYAEKGFPVSVGIADLWKLIAPKYTGQPGFDAYFLPHGRAPLPGELFRNPDLADSLKDIASSYGDSFYHGRLAQEIIKNSDKYGGVMSLEDLASFEAEWVKTISTEFNGYTVHEVPPNTQGIATLIALGILEEVGLSRFEYESAMSFHYQIEAMKLAFADLYAHVADSSHMQVNYEQFLSKSYLKQRAQLINPLQASMFETGVPQNSGTAYVCAADEAGMMVSLIQSNYEGFGSGVVIEGTGISMQNRAMGFSLDPMHANYLKPNKRSFHTIIPGFVQKNNVPLAVFGLMGGPMQAQGHVQLMVAMCLFGLSPQAAADAPRWQIKQGFDIQVEPSFNKDLIQELEKLGHQITVANIENSFSFGGAQIIEKTKSGYMAGSDYRKDGLAVGY